MDHSDNESDESDVYEGLPNVEIEQPSLSNRASEEDNSEIENDGPNELAPVMTSNFATSSRGNLAEILTTITEQDRSNVDFDIVQSCGNWDVVSEMHNQRRYKREAIEKEVVLRNSRITPNQVKTETHHIFAKIEKSSSI